ncbi:MAG TPA: pyruvate dehydrogenase complex dihydrolipoamide acetyltransferase [Crocinitomicaceae bacterium]|nr:pyruvate dehydrogenase complex dihydrolipoamide acetyltransferase [Crocinitomicaceae bacterium]
MAEVVYMPKLSDTMTEGVVAEWHKKVGEKVSSGELIAEIETDKATMEFESFYDGTLLYIGVEKGKGAPVNAILAIIGQEGEDISALIQGGAKAETPKSEAPKAEPVQAETPKVETPKTVEVQKPTPTPIAVPSNSGDRVFASPLAKKLAEEKGIDINAVRGTGDNGRIVVRDVEHYVPYVPASVSPIISAPAGVESYEDTAVSQMRKTIARRLGESKFSAPHFYLTINVDMDNAMAARKAINASGDVKISFNDMVIKASAMALTKHPIINSSWLGDVIRKNHHVNIGVAVAVDEGLLVPVVRFANTKGMAQIGEEVRSYAKKAKDKKLQPSDWEGSTFTISNLGMFGIDNFTAIINPPDSCILAVGGIQNIPVVKNGQVVAGNVMTLTMSCDHRVVDGASGAAFLQTLKDYLENPVKMLV